MTEQQGDYITQEEVDEAMVMLGQGYDQIVKDEAPHDFYSQIPNMVDDYGLSPLAYRLYGHLRRVAGENGKCWQNTRTLAIACNMSEGSVSNAKKELLETEFVPFIRIKKIPTKTGFSYDEITLTDLWKINHDVYSKDTVHQVNRSPHERLVHQVKQRITLLKKNSKNNDIAPPADENLAFLTRLYESNIGMIHNTLLADELKEYSAFPRDWLERAFKEMADANVRTWRYVRRCLDSWKQAGKITEKPAKQNGHKGNNHAETTNPPKQYSAADIEKAERINALRASR
jgi:hypothetical protein